MNTLEKGISEMGKRLTRRGFVIRASESLAGSALICGLKSGEVKAQTRRDVPERTAAAFGYSPNSYKLAGKRIVFTNWCYIQPGRFAWSDKVGARSLLENANPEELRVERFDDPYGIKLIAQSATRMGPVLKPEYPWEAMGTSFQTLFREQGVFRAWSVSNPELIRNYFGYIESKDGWTWERPKLGTFSFEGSTQNNLLFQQGWNRSVFIDPKGLSTERYKMVMGDWYAISERHRQVHPGGVGGSVSSDGLDWTTLPQPICEDYNDTQNTAYYDPWLGKYVLYNRKIIHGRRAIGRSESSDFRHFPFPELVIEPGQHLLPSSDLYMNCRTTIPDAPDHHLMFPTVYQISSDTSSIEMLSSFDGEVWHWLPGGPVLTAGPFGGWDSGWLTAHPNLIELPNGDFALAYTGQNITHKYPRGQLQYRGGYAIWPKGRIVALEAVERGQFSTFALIPPGRKLLINAVTERSGSILVEVVGVEKRTSTVNAPERGIQVLPGRSFGDAKPIVGDHYKTPVTWNGLVDLGYKHGTAIVLRFRMEKAKLFGLDFE